MLRQASFREARKCPEESVADKQIPTSDLHREVQDCRSQEQPVHCSVKVAGISVKL